MRTSVALVLCGCCWSLSVGCSHMVENRVVTAFSDSLKDHDLAQLEKQSSADFKKKAVQGDDTFRALKLIDLPEGKHKVVNVKDVKDDDKHIVEKLATVEIGDKRAEKIKVRFRLKPGASSGQWVVDDLYLSRADEKANKSVGNRLAVVIPLLDALDAWKVGERDRILAVATPEFAQSLSDLSPPHLARFAKQVTADIAEQTRVLAQDRIGDETAEMRVPKESGELVMKFRKIDDRWKLDDLQVESRRNSAAIASARQVSAALSAAVLFQEAYRKANKLALEEISTPQFFKGSLAAADLSLVELPGVSNGEEKFDLKLDGTSATFIVPAGSEMVKLTLEQQNPTKFNSTSRYLVDDVTIYELNGSQDKRLSALFTAHQALNDFSVALAEHNLKALRAHSTHDFSQRVWSLVVPEYFARLPLDEIQPTNPRILQTDFKGSLTEILVEQGDTPLTYVLRDEGGRMLVDDVLIPSLPENQSTALADSREHTSKTDRTLSLKTNIAMLLPILKFADGLQDSKMEDVRGASTDEFSRLAWNYLDKTPEFERDPQPHLSARMSGLTQQQDRAVVVLGDDRFGARVELIKERGGYRIDDVLLISGPADDQRVGLKREVRTHLARNH
ncbi:MAG: hypothetical protein EXS05_15505 [Planctomycetaceae bacterium]|nr:hypothetical protein [Planctomycetaceae bacterium]